MQDRYALRFESGERRGETIPLTRRGLTLGRRPGSSVQILDASVSGRHAEIGVDDEGALLRDLGSTNGTRVGGERVSERRLAHGDAILLGNVRLTFIDREVDPDPPADEVEIEGLDGPASAVAPSDEDAGEAVRTIAADKVARTRTRPVAALAGVVLIAAAAGGAWWWLGSRSPRNQGRVDQPVTAVEGDLLAAGFSFEEARGGWEDDERAPAGFEPSGAARRSGEVGLRAELGRGEGGWALSASPQARVPSGRSLVARGWLAAEDGGLGQLGVVLASSTGAAAQTTAWSAVRAADDPGEVELVVDVPAVYDSARALLLARLADGADAGAVDADDVSLVAAAPRAGRPKFGETELFVSGTAAVLFEIDHALLSDIALVGKAAGDPFGARALLRGEVDEVGLRLAPASPGGQARTLSLYVEPRLAAAGIASTGAGGYRTHQLEFEREGATALLFGGGRDLVRVGLAAPSRVAGRPESEGFRIEAELAAGQDVLLQLSFRAEREAAEALARQARAAQEAGRPGAALARWQELLDEFPFEAALVSEAGASRARLEQAGLEELSLLRKQLERARFFRLVDLFRQCRARAAEIGERYAASDVAAQASALAGEIEDDLRGLEGELDRHERARLLAIEEALRAQGSARLAARVRERLEARFGSAAAPDPEGR